MELDLTDDRKKFIAIAGGIALLAGMGGVLIGHLSTYGDEARDVFYVVDEAGGPLAPERAEALRAAVAATLDRAD